MNSKELAWLIRRHGVEMTHCGNSSHIGSILSVADIVAVLYSDILHFDPKNPLLDDRDRILLSKGHAGAAIYIALAESGYFPIQDLLTHCQNGGLLSGHVSHHVPGVEISTGSLGHGLSIGCGMALAAKKDKKEHNVFVILGDGECDEGAVWEAALLANHYRLDNLIAIIDHNHMQSLDYCEKTIELESLSDKWRAFGWNVLEVDGHNHGDLQSAFTTKFENNKPLLIIANTVKGHGISFMESNITWHYRSPHEGWEYDCAINELHNSKPEGIMDPYTPNGIVNPKMPEEDEKVYVDETISSAWHPSYFGLVKGGEEYEN